MKVESGKQKAGDPVLSDEIPCQAKLKVKLYCRLHHTWRLSGDDSTEPRIRLLERGSANVRQRTGCCSAWIVYYQAIGHCSIYVSEVRMVEEVIDLPAK